LALVAKGRAASGNVSLVRLESAKAGFQEGFGICVLFLGQEPLMAMFKTKNDLAEDTRAKVIELLNARLADAVDLQTQTKYARWSVKGPNCIALHELFDKINEDVAASVDQIAERVV
jgi:hypothetical protein